MNKYRTQRHFVMVIEHIAKRLCNVQYKDNLGGAKQTKPVSNCTMQKKGHSLISINMHTSELAPYIQLCILQEVKNMPSFWPEGPCALAHSASPDLLPICAAATIHCELVCCRLTEPTCLHGTFHADEELQGQRCPKWRLPAVLTAASKQSDATSTAKVPAISIATAFRGEDKHCEAAVPVFDALACSHELISTAWTFHVGAACRAYPMPENVALLACAGQA